MEEMRQSIRIIRQAMREMPGGPVNVDAEARPIESFDLVDQAKMGTDRRPRERPDSTVEPTLDGTERPYHDRVMPQDKRVVLPSKEDTYGNIEGLMNHFKLIMDYHGIRPPQGTPTSRSRAPTANWASMSSATAQDRPYRVRVRPPCFFNMAVLHTHARGVHGGRHRGHLRFHQHDRR